MKNAPEITTAPIPSASPIASVTGGIHREMLEADKSMFELVVVAANRCKQLTDGANPRIEANYYKRKNTSIAVEEVRKGLVPFTTAEVIK